MKRFSILSFALSVGLAFVANSYADRPLSNSKFDPSAEQVELFAAMDEGRIDVKVIPKNEFGGNLLIENKGEVPLTVKLPAGFVGVPVLAQFNTFGGGGQMGAGGGQQGGGQNQAFGGGGIGGQQGGGGQQGNFFSIPPQKVLRVPYTSVCLEHGKPVPHARTPYKLIPVEQYTEDPVLQSLVKMVGTGRLDTPSAQAAAWNVANGMSWDELAAKKYDRIGVPDSPYFSRNQLLAAQSIVASAQGLAKESGEEPTEQSAPNRARSAR